MVELGAVTLTKGVSGLTTRDTVSTAGVKDLITKATFLMARNVVSVISASSLVIKDTVAMAVVGNSVIGTIILTVNFYGQVTRPPVPMALMVESLVLWFA